MIVIELPFTTLEIYDNYVVGRTKVGVNLSIENHLEVLKVLSEHLTAPYAFIVDDVNSYSVDLAVMQHINKDKNISCIGVVYYRAATKIALGLGQYLIAKPIYFSTNINKVTEWAKEKLEN